MFKLRNFFHVIIFRGNSKKLVGVHLHVEEKYLEWLNLNCDSIIDEIANSIAESIDDIERRSLAPESQTKKETQGKDLNEFKMNNNDFEMVTCNGSTIILYDIDRREHKYRILESSYEIQQYNCVSVYPFSIRMWVYPSNHCSSIPSEFFVK